MVCTVLIGMEKPIPSTAAAATFALLMPMTSPSAFTSAPPELPGLIAASVCSSFTRLSLTSSVRFSALITPTVTLP